MKANKQKQTDLNVANCIASDHTFTSLKDTTNGRNAWQQPLSPDDKGGKRVEFSDLMQLKLRDRPADRQAERFPNHKTSTKRNLTTL